jgi:hypothetical protein
MSAKTILNAGLVLLIAGVVFMGTPLGEAEEAGKSTLKVRHTQNANVVPLYEVFEITFHHKGKYENPFFDVTVELIFISPSGREVRVGGFLYGSSKKPKIRLYERDERRHVEYTFERYDLWKARLAPWELGRWRYSYVFSNVRGERATGEGSFICIKGRNPNHGFVRQNPENPFRWVFDDGTPYFPIGLQEGWGDWSGTGTVLDMKSMEGPFRTDRTDLVELPPGPLFVRGPSMNPQNADVYARRYSRAGFNLYRFSQRNNTFNLYSDLDHYLVQEGVMTDELLQHLRKYGFRIFYGIFGFGRAFNFEPENAEAMEKVKRFVKYTVDRWGAYVDFWELFNEQKADDRWYEIVASYLKSIDPYHHPVATSWERPDLPWIDINAPHWYQKEDELRSDEITASKAKRWKRFGKPVIVGEQGNYVNPKKPRPPGVGGVWDPRSALRMRIRIWTAFFNEIALIFWNTSYARDGHFMNIWLGPREREYVRALQCFAYSLDKGIHTVPVKVSAPDLVRAYGLASKEKVGVYLHHYRDHTMPVRGVKVTVDVPKGAKGYWYSPETAEILDTFDAPAGRGTFEAPEFVVDLALLITPDGAPDIDGDGLPNHMDPDDDNDGVSDVEDAFPLEPEEWADEDGDLIGDNLDADDDGDGVGDDENHNGIPDHRELDFDGDGVPRARTVPWDAFPFDPKEWRDTDGDGVGDNADEDDDGDGWSDEEEKRAGTDPLDKLSFPRKASVPRLKVNPKNPRWFDYGGKTIALFGSGIWTIIPDVTVDVRKHNEWYAKYGSNANRATLFAFCTSIAGGKGLAPWRRTGPGRANDGLPKFDLTKWDERFWERLHEYLSDCQSRGIIVLLQMWDEPFVERGSNRWRLNPFNPENNINDIPGLPGGEGSAEKEFYDPDNAVLMRFQDGLIKKLLDETAERYGNIIYEIGNEINMDSLTPKAERWQRHWIEFFREYERVHGVELLLSNDTRERLFRSGAQGFDVVNHHGFLGFRIPLRQVGDMPVRVYDAVQRDFERYRRPVINSRPCSDPDRRNYPDVASEDVGRVLYWSYFCGGGHIVGFRTTNESWKEGLAAERIIRSVHTFMKRLNLERLTPHRELVGGGLCLADVGREYVVYLPRGGKVTVDLSGVKGRMMATWYNPRECRDEREREVAGGGKRSFQAPGDGDWVLHLVRR